MRNWKIDGCRLFTTFCLFSVRFRSITIVFPAVFEFVHSLMEVNLSRNYYRVYFVCNYSNLSSFEFLKVYYEQINNVYSKLFD